MPQVSGDSEMLLFFFLSFFFFSFFLFFPFFSFFFSFFFFYVFIFFFFFLSFPRRASKAQHRPHQMEEQHRRHTITGDTLSSAHLLRCYTSMPLRPRSTSVLFPPSFAGVDSLVSLVQWCGGLTRLLGFKSVCWQAGFGKEDCSTALQRWAADGDPAGYAELLCAMTCSSAWQSCCATPSRATPSRATPSRATNIHRRTRRATHAQRVSPPPSRPPHPSSHPARTQLSSRAQQPRPPPISVVRVIAIGTGIMSLWVDKHRPRSLETLHVRSQTLPLKATVTE